MMCVGLYLWRSEFWVAEKIQFPEIGFNSFWTVSDTFPGLNGFAGEWGRIQYKILSYHFGNSHSGGMFPVRMRFEIFKLIWLPGCYSMMHLLQGAEEYQGLLFDNITACGSWRNTSCISNGVSSSWRLAWINIISSELCSKTAQLCLL